MKKILSARGWLVFLTSNGLVLCLLGCATPRPSHVQTFLRSQDIDLQDDASTYYPRWTATVTNNDGVGVTVRSEPETRRVRLAFQDESRWRDLYTRIIASVRADGLPNDPHKLNLANDLEAFLEYYPHRLRLSPDHRYLYLEVIGRFWAGPVYGWQGEKLLYTYDLQNREHRGGRPMEVGGEESALRFDEERRRERAARIESGASSSPPRSKDGDRPTAGEP